MKIKQTFNTFLKRIEICFLVIFIILVVAVMYKLIATKGMLFCDTPVYENCVTKYMIPYTLIGLLIEFWLVRRLIRISRSQN